MNSSQPARPAPPFTIYQRLPHELIIQILYDALHLGNQSQSLRPVDYDRFQCHVSRYGRLGRHLVLSKSLYALVIEVFYRGNQVKCDYISRSYPHNLGDPSKCGVLMPPLRARHHVRRIEVSICLRGYGSDFTSSLHGRTLKNLTFSTDGSSELEVLRLAVEPSHLRLDNDVIERLKSAGIVIRAKEEVVIEGWRDTEKFVKVEAKVVKRIR